MQINKKLKIRSTAIETLINRDVVTFTVAKRKDDGKIFAYICFVWVKNVKKGASLIINNKAIL